MNTRTKKNIFLAETLIKYNNNNKNMFCSDLLNLIVPLGLIVGIIVIICVIL